ncbi:MAG: hypothetical protein ACE5LL_08885, partial [Alphaproteobacteria bacterium]
MLTKKGTFARRVEVHEWPLKVGITRTKEFEKKGLCTHAVNVGLRCGNLCLYCSTPATPVGCHEAFKALGLPRYGMNYSIIDPNTVGRLAQGRNGLKSTDVVQLCTTVDAWATEARRHRLGRRCLRHLLKNTSAQVRV